MSPKESLGGKMGSPVDWLGFGRYENEIAVTEFEVRSADWRGSLRGVKEICLNRLKKAMDLKVEKGEFEGTFYVYEEGRKNEGEWVNLSDPQIDRCHCADFVFRGEQLGTPCKHILAALICDGHEDIVELAETLSRREALAAAVSMAVGE